LNRFGLGPRKADITYLPNSALVLNSQDRCIRYITLSPFPPSPPSDSEDEEAAAVFELPPPRPPRIPYFTVEHKFQDLVNRTPWNGCGVSSDGEYIIGGKAVRCRSR
jgi:COMPASS component SWD1